MLAVTSFVAALAVMGTVSAQHHWAVIMAGSNTYSNYRHQADACHAYQIAKGKGIPEERIILLAYDDIAHNQMNPFKGKMFNKPNGPDVYEGCKISYSGKKVTGENFLKVLTGDASAPGPVLKSTSDDRVFIYYADHGGPGILGVPQGVAGGYIHAKDINQALQKMHSKGMYKELLFYVEACESGSIFQNLLKAPNAVAITATTATAPSYGFYCPPQDKVNGKEIRSCLGDEFSIRWMEDADVANFKSETVAQQVAKVTKAVKKSHVQTFGDIKTIGKDVIGDFEGGISHGNSSSLIFNPIEDSDDSSVNSRDIPVHLAYYELKRATTLEERRIAQDSLGSLLAKRKAQEDQFISMAIYAMAGDLKKAQDMMDGTFEAIEDVDCHSRALKVVTDYCGPFDDYTMRHSRLFVNFCNSNMAFEQIQASVLYACPLKSGLPDVVV